MAYSQLEPLISHQQLDARIKELARKITVDYSSNPGEEDLRMIAVLNGAFVFLADLMREIDRDVSVDFLAANSYGSSTTTSGEVKITKDLDHEIAGLDVLLVEDIVDTGLTVNYLLQVLQQRRPRSLRVVTLLDKPSRRLQPVPLAYVGFEIPDRFVVGYGLDYAQRYRNLPDVCVLEEDRPAQRNAF